MPKEKKRLSKAAKAAQKILADSKLLADAKAELNSKGEFRSSVVSPRENTLAIKPRPHKKRG